MLLTDADQLREALAIALRERDEARAEVEREKASATRGWQTADELHLTVRDLKAEVERLKADNSVTGNYWSFAAALRDVAERQREACAEKLHRTRLGARVKIGTAVQIVSETPLVTEGEP